MGEGVDAGVVFGRVAVLGVGLIGASVALAARRGGRVGTVVAYDASAGVRERVRELGLADHVAADAAEAVRDADHVIFCVPVGAIGAVAAEVVPHLKPGAVLSDVGSVKGSVVAAVVPLLPAGVEFVPAHPVAGTEFSGPDAGFAGLFEDRWCILTPCEASSDSAMARVRALWESFGARVDTMTPAHHDLVLAITSHVPHLIAYNIVGTAEELESVTNSEVIKFSAGGFRDFTRIAASDPTMWRDVFLNNREAVLEMLGRFLEDLSSLQRMVRFGDGDGLFAFFTKTRAIRRSIVAVGQETAAADFGRRDGTPSSRGGEDA